MNTTDKAYDGQNIVTVDIISSSGNFCSWNLLHIKLFCIYCKRGYLRVGEIYTCYAVSLKPSKIHTRARFKTQNFKVVNHALVYCLTIENFYTEK